MCGSVKRRFFVATIIAVLLAGSLVAWWPDRVNADSDQVTVRPPDFAVTVDGESIDNAYMTYPVIEYKDIRNPLQPQFATIAGKQ